MTFVMKFEELQIDTVYDQDDESIRDNCALSAC